VNREAIPNLYREKPTFAEFRITSFNQEMSAFPRNIQVIINQTRKTNISMWKTLKISDCKIHIREVTLAFVFTLTLKTDKKLSPLHCYKVNVSSCRILTFTDPVEFMAALTGFESGTVRLKFYRFLTSKYKGLVRIHWSRMNWLNTWYY
jgi:hypothetical protein